MKVHKLRRYVDSESPIITDEELDEVESKIKSDKCVGSFSEYAESYEYSGHFIFTKNVVDRDVAVENMCCGIITKDINLSNGETIYFAFDYGH